MVENTYSQTERSHSASARASVQTDAGLTTQSTEISDKNTSSNNDESHVPERQLLSFEEDLWDKLERVAAH